MTKKTNIQKPDSGTDSEMEKKSKKSLPLPSDATSKEKKHPNDPVFPVIGLGASAGGLEALKLFFSSVPEKSGMAFVVVVHLSAKQPSMMPALLQKVSSIPVKEIKNGQIVEPNHIYVISPNKEIALNKNKIQELDIVDHGIRHPIDIFFDSLARDKGKLCAAIILSGTGTDGTKGLTEIKKNNGFIMVQSRASAMHNGMPCSALGTGLSDMELKPEEMPQRLIEHFSSLPKEKANMDQQNQMDQKWLNKTFSIIHARFDKDFSDYKQNTIIRRINRRMSLKLINLHKNYVRLLRENPAEVDALFCELLIGVTSFFRDAGSYHVLKTNILPLLYDQISTNSTLRVWVPGCSSGEEVYSLAIVLQEYLENNPKNIDYQIFSTDIDPYAIEKARHGIYPASISEQVSKERLDRFFIVDGDSFRIRKEIRDRTIFSIQNIIDDPPFSRLQLLCCRNLLIYLNSETQKKLLPLFHHTLVTNGVLMLGSSESIGAFTHLFKALDKKWKIFQKLETPQSKRQTVYFPSGKTSKNTTPMQDTTSTAGSNINTGRITQNVLLEQFAPTAILVNEKSEIIYVHGRTGNYLETPSGPPTNNILNLARKGLKVELSGALRKAKSSGRLEKQTRVSVNTDGDTRVIDLIVSPMKTPKELTGHFLIVLKEIETRTKSDESKQDSNTESTTESTGIAELEAELLHMRENHLATVEELESSNEDLKTTNEELQSSNEELQSTNEELESSKEELQSLNEELQTVNSELQSKVEELSEAHDDMHNLLNSTEIATIFTDSNLNLRRFTAEATSIINLIQSDIGRPIHHVVSKLAYSELISDCKQVLKDLLN